MPIKLDSKLKEKLDTTLDKKTFTAELEKMGCEKYIIDGLWNDFCEVFLFEFAITGYSTLPDNIKTTLWEGLDTSEEQNTRNLPIIVERISKTFHTNPELFDFAEIHNSLKATLKESFQIYLNERIKNATIN